MVAVHDIPLDQCNAGSVGGAVALSLSAQSERDRVHHIQAEGWEVELRRGRYHVVARTNQPLAGNALIDAAIDHAHRALDLTSVEDGDHLVTRAPADNYIVFELVDGRRIVRFQSVSDLPISMDMTATVIRADGTVEPQPIRPSLAWAPAFRFHRLSQGSRDLFDAYHNMFLGLEALLDQLFPKGRQEGEKAWLQRSVASAGAKVDLARLATPGAADPARDLVDRLYGVRVHLFHAKTGPDTNTRRANKLHRSRGILSHLTGALDGDRSRMAIAEARRRGGHLSGISDDDRKRLRFSKDRSNCRRHAPRQGGDYSEPAWLANVSVH